MISVRIISDTNTRDLMRLEQESSPQMMRQLFAEIGREFVAMTVDNFGVDKPNRPSTWRQLTPKYQKRIGYFGPPKLELSGRLKNSIQIGNVQSNEVTVESLVEYSDVHQFGGGNNIPARPYFPIEKDNVGGGYQLTPYAAQRIQGVLENHFRI